MSKSELKRKNVQQGKPMMEGVESSASPAGYVQNAWLVENGEQGNKLRYRTWRDGCPTWTEDPYEATWYCRREDAERVHADDEGAWIIAEHGFDCT